MRLPIIHSYIGISITTIFSVLQIQIIIYLWIPVSDYGLKWDLFKLFRKAFAGGQVFG